MRHVALVPIVLAGALLPGCSGSDSRQAEALTGPHQGSLVKLPDGRGYAEILDLDPGKGRSSSRGDTPSQVAVYFLATDGKGPTTGSASGVAVELTIATGQPPRVVPLDAAPDATDPAGKARFLSKPGVYHLSESTGDLIASLDGQAIKVPFDGLR